MEAFQSLVKILLVRLRLIGDVVFTTPAIGALRRRFPDARLTYLVEAPAEPVVAHHPDLDDIIVVERPRGLARLRYDVRARAALRADGFDVAIDFHGGPRSGFLTWATRRAAAHRLRPARPRLVLHDARAVDAIAASAAPLGAESVGSAGAARHRAPDRRAMR